MNGLSEEFHKSLKSNASLSKSPTKTIKTQANHVFMAIYSVFKFECLKIKHAPNHFTLRTKLLIFTNQIVFMDLQRLKGAYHPPKGINIRRAILIFSTRLVMGVPCHTIII